MLYEGLVHHFDQFRNLAGADGESVAGYSWNPAWTTFANDTTAAFVLRMTNGVVGQFEVNHLARGTQNGWHQEGYRVECEHGAVTVDADERVRTHVHLGGNRLQVTDVAPVVAPYADHDEVIRQFLDWLDGGPAPETAIEDNIHTAALSFAAVEAVRTGTMVDVRALTRDGLDRVTPAGGSREGGVPCP
jgi:predicted dehydrogenase